MPRKYDDEHRMPNREIEDEANRFLASYRQKYPGEWNVPICVPDILDCLDNFYVDIEDLQKKHGPDVLGAIFLREEERRIVVDSSLDPEVNPKMLGRFNFTVAHEAGHWVLHAPQLLAAERTPSLFSHQGYPLILCRTSKCSRKPEMERQADRFASYLLMPRECVSREWRSRHGETLRAVNVAEELKELRLRFRLPENSRKVTCQIAQDFAPAFGVSPEAMQIRLSELGYIQLEEERQLFLF